jgi:hypothetical protein
MSLPTLITEASVPFYKRSETMALESAMAERRWIPVPGETSFSRSFCLSGIPVWTSEWIYLGESVILPREKHDSTPTGFAIYEIRDGGEVARFAAAEICPGGYSFYVQSDVDPAEPVRRVEAIKAYLTKTSPQR